MTVAKNIEATILNRPLKSFRFKMLGQLASIGHHTGVAMVFGIKFSGFIAWWFWRSVYLMKLPRLAKKLRVMVSWTLDLFFGQEIEQMITFRDIEELSGQLARTRTRTKQADRRARLLCSPIQVTTCRNESSMKRCYEIPQALVKISFIGVTQLFATIGIAFARDDPPPSSVRPWAPPTLPRYEGELRNYQPTEAERRYLPAIDPRKTYNLAELIDIAQRSNPETRVAWERARMAAAAVGLTESAYYPYIVAAAAGGYYRAFVPFPQLRTKLQPPPTNGNLPNVDIVGGGTLVTESLLARAELDAKWLLIDFGERSATRAAAREKLMMANVGFNGTHQKIVFDVHLLVHELGTARQKVLVTQSALHASKTVEQAAQTRFDNGLATKPELLQAQQQSAQSGFDLRGKPRCGKRRQCRL